MLDLGLNYWQQFVMSYKIDFFLCVACVFSVKLRVIAQNAFVIT